VEQAFHKDNLKNLSYFLKN